MLPITERSVVVAIPLGSQFKIADLQHGFGGFHHFIEP
jgi:hypothetical protein